MTNFNGALYFDSGSPGHSRNPAPCTEQLERLRGVQWRQYQPATNGKLNSSDVSTPKGTWPKCKCWNWLGVIFCHIWNVAQTLQYQTVVHSKTLSIYWWQFETLDKINVSNSKLSTSKFKDEHAFLNYTACRKNRSQSSKTEPINWWETALRYFGRPL